MPASSALATLSVEPQDTRREARQSHRPRPHAVRPVVHDPEDRPHGRRKHPSSEGIGEHAHVRQHGALSSYALRRSRSLRALHHESIAPCDEPAPRRLELPDRREVLPLPAGPVASAGVAAPGGTGPVGPFPPGIDTEEQQVEYDKRRRRVLWTLPYGLYVVGSRAGERRNGMTLNWARGF